MADYKDYYYREPTAEEIARRDQIALDRKVLEGKFFLSSLGIPGRYGGPENSLSTCQTCWALVAGDEKQPAHLYKHLEWHKNA